MTNRRRREVERMITDLGLVIGGFRTNGNSHWRVDVLTPDRAHQRPFTFPTSGHDGPRRFDEISMIRRWRRQVAPEMDVMEDAGTLRPGNRTPLAEKLAELGIPLKRDDGESAPPVGISVMKVREIESPPFEKKRLHLSPAKWTAKVEPFQTKPDPMIAALPSVSQQVAAATPKTPKKEPAMSAQTTPINGSNPQPKPGTVNGGHAKKGVKNNFLGRLGEIKLADWLRVQGRLDGPTNSILLAEAAAKDLGLTITHSNVLSLLKDLGLEIKQMTRRDSGKHTTRIEYMASILVDVLERQGATVPDALVKIALNEPGLTLHNAPMPVWPDRS